MGRKHRMAKQAFVAASSATTGYLDDHQGAKRILISAAGGTVPSWSTWCDGRQSHIRI